MADFLTRLAERTLGLLPTVRPVIAPLFAPEPGSFAVTEGPVWGQAAPEVSPARLFEDNKERSETPLVLRDESAPQLNAKRPSEPVASSRTTRWPATNQPWSAPEPGLRLSPGVRDPVIHGSVEAPQQPFVGEREVVQAAVLPPLEPNFSNVVPVAKHTPSTVVPAMLVPSASDRQSSPAPNKDAIASGRKLEPVAAAQRPPIGGREDSLAGQPTSPLPRPLEEERHALPATAVPRQQRITAPYTGRRSQRASENAEPAAPLPPATINVSIGRIEVRATPALSQPQKPRIGAQVMGLDEYLRERSARGSK